ncbi:hypothetical protein LZ31DRAFT_40084 [Colletotrichum somersetense]|nr:hypothetical protein LZ31DRAFT_40084 [Colletotrichum somersetense]
MVCGAGRRSRKQAAQTEVAIMLAKYIWATIHTWAGGGSPSRLPARHAQVASAMPCDAMLCVANGEGEALGRPPINYAYLLHVRSGGQKGSAAGTGYFRMRRGVKVWHPGLLSLCPRHTSTNGINSPHLQHHAAARHSPGAAFRSSLADNPSASNPSTMFATLPTPSSWSYKPS